MLSTTNTDITYELLVQLRNLARFPHREFMASSQHVPDGVSTIACTNEGETVVLFSDHVSNGHASYLIFLQDARVQERETTRLALYSIVFSTAWALQPAGSSDRVGWTDDRMEDSSSS